MSGLLSVCCLTGDPVSRVAAALAPFRGLADELVIGFDDRVDESRAREYGQLAERVLPVRFEFAERHLDELHRACSGNWILRVDTDEVPSAGLLRALPEVVRDPDIRQYRIPRRWLYPDPDHWVDELPWWPDFQIRLVRNDPSLAFAGELHTSADPELPARYLDTPLYHLDCVLTTHPARRDKAQHYESIRPGLKGHRGLPVNAAYEPEVYASLPPRPVPSEDRDLIDSLIAAGPPARHAATRTPARRAPTRTPARGEDPEDSRHETGVNPESAPDAVIEPFGRDHRLVVGLRSAIHVHVTNNSDEEWPGEGRPGSLIRLGYRWLAGDGTPVVEEAARSAFPCTVAPGGSTIAPLTVVPPSRPGAWTLEVDVVHELVRWYRCELRLELEVLERPEAPRVLFMGGWSPYRHVGDDAILRVHLRELERRVPGADAVVLADLPDAVSARFGVQAASGVYAYLHEGITRQTPRRRAMRLMTGRTLRLIRHARDLRRGREARPLHATAAELLEALSHADLVVGASAGSLCSNYWLEALWPQAAMALAASTLGVPVVLSRVTVGPFAGVADRLVAAALFHVASEISIRDGRRSRGQLRRLAILGARVRDTVDAAWQLPSAPRSVIERALRERGIPPGEPFAVLSGHGPHVQAVTEHLGLVAGALADRHGLRSLFIPMVTGTAATDEQVASELAARYGGSDGLSVLSPLPPDEVIAGIARQARIAVGTRYHLAVFAVSGGVPAIGLYTEESERKLRGLAETASGLLTCLPAGTPAADVAASAKGLIQGSRPPAPGAGPGSESGWFGSLEQDERASSVPAPHPRPRADPPAREAMAE